MDIGFFSFPCFFISTPIGRSTGQAAQQKEGH
jgi:hypothetical protein